MRPVRPWLALPPQLAHDLSPWVLTAIGRLYRPHIPQWRPFTWKGIHFENPLGVAGGVDKDGESVRGWWALGAGFVEVGTVTPQAQTPNPGTIIGRSVAHEALWNRMGFPNKGVAHLRRRLSGLRKPYLTPVFINIGKNRDTQLENASRDYIACLEQLNDLADAFVVNISSPNTEGLRQLFTKSHFESFLTPIMESRQKQSTIRPLLLKLSPDLSDADLARGLEMSCDLGVDGWVLTNTTAHEREGLPFPSEGGVSGRPLAHRAEQALRKSMAILGAKRAGKLVVSVGGVLSPEDVETRLALGADLVQAYSALIFRGPGFFRQVAKQFQAHKKRSPPLQSALKPLP